MTYIRVSMIEKESGYDRIEEIRAENEEFALEGAEELFPECEDFKVVRE